MPNSLEQCPPGRLERSETPLWCLAPPQGPAGRAAGPGGMRRCCAAAHGPGTAPQPLPVHHLPAQRQRRSRRHAALRSSPAEARGPGTALPGAAAKPSRTRTPPSDSGTSGSAATGTVSNTRVSVARRRCRPPPPGPWRAAAPGADGRRCIICCCVS
jgi:hypothetical protein